MEKMITSLPYKILENEENNAIIPSNDKENYWQQTYAIYLNNLDSNNIFQMSEDVYPDLDLIANLPGGVYGEGVYNARGMLGLMIEPDFEIDIFDERIAQNNGVSIYPNPAANHISIEGINMNDVERVTIYDNKGFGKIVLLKPTDHNVFLNNLSNGYYILRIQMFGGMEFTASFIISK